MPVELTTRTERGHAAEAAWLAIRPDSPPATGIETIKKTSKSAVYRLTGAGPKNSAVIAKRCELASALIECRIYEDILPSLGVPGLGYYGAVPEDGGLFHWLFLEDSQGEQYDPDVSHIRNSVTQYVASIHNASRMHAFDNLPNRTAAHYLSLLESSRTTIERFTQEASIEATRREALDSVLRECDRLQVSWPHLESSCGALPAAMVHCDLRPKNIHVRMRDNRVFLLDWEYAGWGCPACDIAFLDPNAYWLCVREHYPGLNVVVLSRIQKAGEVFQWLAAVSWASESLQDDCNKSIARLRSYGENPVEWRP